MKKINNIIDSELIARTNNHKLRQEYGEVGMSPNITSEGTSTIFTTKHSIKNISYVTVNGVNLIEGVHYVKATSNTIKISNSGAPVRKNPTITTTILVSYYAGYSKDLSIKVPPTLNYFRINKQSGRDAEIIFDFNITPANGRNIFWSIHKDGSKESLYSGNSLSTLNGISVSNGKTTLLNHFISEQEFLKRLNQDITFTLIIVYDLTEDASNLDEKIVANAVYKVDDKQDVTGFISVSEEFINKANAFNEIVATYVINKDVNVASIFDWYITRSLGGATGVIVRQGNQASSQLSGEISENVATALGDNFDIRYALVIVEPGEPERVMSTDKVTISVPAAEAKARAGYLDASIMSYIDSVDNVRRKIGSLGTARDLIEYNNRVPSTIFTKLITRDYLTSQELISADVNTFSGSVSMVYFVIEIPDSWGPVSFYQSLGLVGPSSFNKISLGNGYTAYLYNVAPSDHENPSDYNLKSRA